MLVLCGLRIFLWVGPWVVAVLLIVIRLVFILFDWCSLLILRWLLDWRCFGLLRLFLTLDIGLLLTCVVLLIVAHESLSLEEVRLPLVSSLLILLRLSRLLVLFVLRLSLVQIGMYFVEQLNYLNSKSSAH